jgi:hypothetical protein
MLLWHRPPARQHTHSTIWPFVPSTRWRRANVSLLSHPLQHDTIASCFSAATNCGANHTHAHTHTAPRHPAHRRIIIHYFLYHTTMRPRTHILCITPHMSQVLPALLAGSASALMLLMTSSTALQRTALMLGLATCARGWTCTSCTSHASCARWHCFTLASDVSSTCTLHPNKAGLEARTRSTAIRLLTTSLTCFVALQHNHHNHQRGPCRPQNKQEYVVKRNNKKKKS